MGAFDNAGKGKSTELWCLSNDISEWSRKLRKIFGLERYFKGFIISGDAGVRKPDPAIYMRLLEAAGIQPHDAMFVDDRRRNVEAAAGLGISAILFNPALQESQGCNHTIARNFSELLNIVFDRR
jgi:FMN phosphatase YigB (HAD superfamily)